MKNDICCEKLVAINRQQAEQVARLMTLAHGLQYHVGSCDLENCFWDCIWASVGGGTHHCLRIVAELLLPTGTFCPKDWLSGYPAEQAGHTKTRNIIRAVFQQPMVWTCTTLPDNDLLAESLDAMEPTAGWKVEAADRGVTLVRPTSEGKCRFPLTLNSTSLWSQQVARGQAHLDQVVVQIDPKCEMMIRLNSALPHLIVLAGGEVEFG